MDEGDGRDSRKSSQNCADLANDWSFSFSFNFLEVPDQRTSLIFFYTSAPSQLRSLYLLSYYEFNYLILEFAAIQFLDV